MACYKNLSLALCSAYQTIIYTSEYLNFSAKLWHYKKEGLKSSQPATAMD